MCRARTGGEPTQLFLFLGIDNGEDWCIMMTALTNYGPLKKGRDYRVINEGSDWVLVATQGKAIYVFKWVFYN